LEKASFRQYDSSRIRRYHALGRSSAEARSQIPLLDKQSLVDQGVTESMANSWGQFYRSVTARYPANPSAEGRAELMEAAARLLNGQ
jgi:hypothetical protein